VTDESVISSLIMPTVVLITGHFSNSAVILKFLGKGQIPRLGGKLWALHIIHTQQ